MLPSRHPQTVPAHVPSTPYQNARENYLNRVCTALRASNPASVKGTQLMAISSTSLPTGPAIGTPFPDFTLADQYGTPVNFTAARAGRRAMIVVHRSAAW